MGTADVSLSSLTPVTRMYLAGIILCLAGNVSARDAMAQRDHMSVCLQQAASTLPDVARSTLEHIVGTPRQLLALRSYLRVRDLEHRWSWTDAQISDYRESPEQLLAQQALAHVQARFSERNPGYALYVNTRVRSLDTQLARWNTNASVGAAADALDKDAEVACKTDASGFAQWLQGWQPPMPATLAAPGLSSHGQARAFDFQVQQGDRIIAGTDSGSIDTDWEAGDWAERLAQAIQDAGPAFEGPLCSPWEPWHYTFNPERMSKQGMSKQDVPKQDVPKQDDPPQPPAGDAAEEVHDDVCD